MSSNGSSSSAGGRKERRRPVLIIQHAQHEHPAAVRRALESQGIQTLWLHPYRGEAYPEISQIRGVISLGGAMGANDDAHHPWIPHEVDLLRRCVEADLPTVGICLGGQMLARALGGRVEKNHIAEVGWHPIQVNETGKKDRILGAAGPNPIVYQWHNDTFHLPPAQAVLLAGSPACPRQAYRVGDKAYGFQFHPEADHQLVHEWLALEGVESEIEAARAEHGHKTVQNAATQRERAAQGEKASLKITAAIGQLFRAAPYQPIEKELRKQYDIWAALRMLLTVEFEGSDRKIARLRGRVAMILTVPEGEFVIFKDVNTLLWPIRMDHISKVMP